ncbi:MAG: TetR/AcrR family transcriptional regulator [Lachnospiraceae bacterium]|nr:TetR/AcrR family transcriptional regulator [Lachnospiraceae bacterium]
MNYTKNAIIDAFWRLLEEKPYGKITVKDIVDCCQVNRNTFYYHFHDIPELLITTIRQNADDTIRLYAQYGSPADCLTPLIENCVTHKKAILSIYHSVHREDFQNELDRILMHVVTQYISTMANDAGSAISAADEKLFARFYKCALSGILLDWLNANMEYDLLIPFARICDLFKGAGALAFQRASIGTQ